jgi:mRNA interferase RelE/StbE
MPGRVSLQVIWEAQAIDQAAGFLRDDPAGVREMLDVAARLAEEPRPAGSFPYGSPDRRRLRISRSRVMYDITAETVPVWHLGRGWAGH